MLFIYSLICCCIFNGIALPTISIPQSATPLLLVSSSPLQAFSEGIPPLAQQASVNSSDASAPGSGLTVTLTADAFINTSLEQLQADILLALNQALNTTAFQVEQVIPGAPPLQGTHFQFDLNKNLLMTINIPFVPQPDRLEQPLNVTYIRQLTDQLNASGLFPQPLLASDTAYVTIVSSSEFTQIQKVGITMDQINNIAAVDYIAYTEMTTLCLALYTQPNPDGSGDDDQAVFIRVSANAWNQVRKDVSSLVLQMLTNMTSAEQLSLFPNATDSVNLLSTQVFNPTRYLPTIYVGETRANMLAADMRDSIGLLDDSCFAELVLTDPANMPVVSPSISKSQVSTDDVTLGNFSSSG